MKKEKISGGETFYKNVLSILNKNKARVMVAGTYAFREYTGINRKTKDFDLFCKASDYTRYLEVLKNAGYKTEIRDARWIAKISSQKHTVDLIFGSSNQIVTVDDTWFENAPTINLFGIKTRLVPVEEFVWEKCYIQTKEVYGGPDINHLILKHGKNLDWKRLSRRMEAHWELLLAHIINFRFVYPSERSLIPKWLIKELIGRLEEQFRLPHPTDKVTRGTLLSRSQYVVDVDEWGFHSIT